MGFLIQIGLAAIGLWVCAVIISLAVGAVVWLFEKPRRVGVAVAVFMVCFTITMLVAR